VIRHHRHSAPLACLLATAIAAIAGCATPVFRTASGIDATPALVALGADRFAGSEVIWGGKILDVRNGAAASELQVAGYPLDRAQRPNPAARMQGRFLVVLPGFVEPLDWPAGHYVTVHGRIEGTRTRVIAGDDYVYPVVTQAEVHLWPENFPRERSRVGFGIGVGIR
jgi:outer membrane lipoprotein